MVGIFKANNPFNTFTLFIYGLLLKLPWFLHPVMPVAQKKDGFVFIELLNALKSIGSSVPVIYPLISYLLLYTQAITFNKLVNDQRLMIKSNYLPAMTYLLITSIFADWNVLSAPLIINTLLIWVWARMSSLYNNQTPKTTLFNIGMVIGLSSFFYFPSLAFALLMVFALIVTRPFRLAEWVISIIGIISPYYFLVAWLFLTDRLKGYRFPAFAVSSPRSIADYMTIAAIGVLLIAFLMGCYYVQKNSRRQLVQTRKSWSLIVLYLLVAVFVPFINASRDFQYWILCAVPLSAFIAAGFLYPPKKWFPLLLHWIMVGFVVAFAWFYK